MRLKLHRDGRIIEHAHFFGFNSWARAWVDGGWCHWAPNEYTIVPLLLVMALLASACGTPTEPTRTQIGRNVDGTPHYIGDPYQPWIATNVTTGDNRIQHPPTP